MSRISRSKTASTSDAEWMSRFVVHPQMRFGGVRALSTLTMVGALALGCQASRPVATRSVSTFELDAARPRSKAAFEQALAQYDAARQAGQAAATLGGNIARIATLGAQRDAHVSRLYWHTSLDEAIGEARASGKPILSLRMLGRLDQELSCANSRFFRTTLYPNPAVSKLLRERFVLHWSSERPVPVVTIDYGDGRKVVRTITGNSIHYVLDENGVPVDALPGLYAADEFTNQLDRLLRSGVWQASRQSERSAFHQAALLDQRARFTDLARRANRPDLYLPDPLPAPTAPPPPVAAGVSAPRVAAANAISVAATKAVVERPLLLPAKAENTSTTAVPFYESFPWDAVAAPAWKNVTDGPSLALMRSKSPRSWHDDKASPLDDVGFRELVRAFEQSLTIDTLKNELGIRRELHRRFIEKPNEDLPSLNTFVYGSLFLTPSSDPWLGLMPPRAFTGLPDDGLLER